jgi:hypothetical protein
MQRPYTDTPRTCPQERKKAAKAARRAGAAASAPQAEAAPSAGHAAAEPADVALREPLLVPSGPEAV